MQSREGLEPTLNGNSLPRSWFCGAQQAGELRWSFGGARLTCPESLQSLGRLEGLWWLLPLETLRVGFDFGCQDTLLMRFCSVLCAELPAHGLGGFRGRCSAGNKGLRV